MAKPRMAWWFHRALSCPGRHRSYLRWSGRRCCAGWEGLRIPVFASLDEALKAIHPKYFVIGLAPDGGRLPADARSTVIEALQHGLNVDSGLHDFLSDDPEISTLAKAHGAAIRDVRKTPGQRRYTFLQEISNTWSASRSLFLVQILL